MEKSISRGSYWLGMVTLVIAFAWKALSSFGVAFSAHMTQNQAISYMTFYKASLLLFLMAIASMGYESLKSPKA